METITTLRETLSADRWNRVNEQLLAKQFAEFMYEDLLDPTVVDRDGDWRTYRLSFAEADYRFRAKSRVFDSYRVDQSSLRRRTDDEWEPATDPIQLLLDAREAIGVDPATAGHLVREYMNTLVADAHIEARADPDVESLLDMDYAEVEGMMNGHPWFTINKGRIGFGYDDYLAYAPENRRGQSLIWIAASRDRAEFRCVSDREYDSLIETSLGEHRTEFDAELADRGLNPSAYYYLPVHEWQWHNTVAQLFADDIATDRLVPLGTGPDTYLPQQSIRTLTDIDDPETPHIKVPIRVLNTIVYRGLPGEQALTAPRVTEFVTGIRDDDAFLREECDLVLPGEVAGLNYDHEGFAQLDDAPYQYHELLGAVWRESVESLLDDGEQPLPLSALMHEDIGGSPVVTTLADRAGLSLEEWLDECLDTLLRPLLHYLYKYGLVFMPHGTNTMLVLEDGRPTRLAIKDYVDEMAVTDRSLPELERIPDDIYANPDILQQKGPEALCQHIFGTTFICVLRYVSDLLERTNGYDERRFWQRVRASIERYQDDFPALSDRFELFDLFKPEFEKLCLNRNRLVEYGYNDDRSPPEITGHGTVTNTLHELSTTNLRETTTDDD